MKIKHIGTQFGNPSEKYHITKKLSDGSASKIYESFDKTTNKKFIVKCIHKSEEWKNEYRILNFIQKFKSKDLVKIIEIFETMRYIYIITEYYNGLDLFEHIDINVPYHETYGKMLTYEMAKCIRKCHVLGIQHLDIKCENFIMLEVLPKPKLVLIDFGHSEKAPENEFRVGCSKYGTTCYLCPEGYENIYSTKSDIWSLGICIHIILTGEFPFKGNHKKAYLNNKKDTLRISNKLSPEAYDLVSRCLCINPSKRISIKEVIASNFLKNLSD